MGHFLVLFTSRTAHETGTDALDPSTTSPKNNTIFLYSQGMDFITQSLPATHSKQANLNKGS